jgi:signal transduction histidine kinase
MMRNAIIVVLLGVVTVCPWTSLAQEKEEKATPQEVYELVIKAATMLEQLGSEGLTALSDTREFALKDSYVYAVNCDEDTVVAHPSKKYIGLKLSEIYDKNPDESKRKLHNLEMCDGANSPNGIWVEYWWEKLDDETPHRKISFMIQVPGQPYQVTAGIYNDTVTIEELNETLK